MNKSLILIIGAIVVVGGFIGYTMLGKASSSHTTDDGHTQAEHAESAPHDDTGVAPHNN